jgi:hypothetical protein
MVGFLTSNGLDELVRNLQVLQCLVPVESKELEAREVGLRILRSIYIPEDE